MARHATGDEELFARREIRDAFRSGLGVGPGPSREFVDEIVACEDELFRCDLAGCAEGGSVGDGGPAIAEGVEG